jgi:hypothetical protein
MNRVKSLCHRKRQIKVVREPSTARSIGRDRHVVFSIEEQQVAVVERTLVERLVTPLICQPARGFSGGRSTNIWA